MGNYKSRRITSEQKHEEYLDKKQKQRLELKKEQLSFDRKIFEEGKQKALEGYDLEQCGELSNNKDFLNGFKMGLRLLYIEQINSQQKRKK